jgi:hypothetical protein
VEKERRIKAERVTTIVNKLHAVRSVAIVVTEDAPIRHISEGLHAAFKGRVLLLEALNLVQGEDLGYDYASEVTRYISQHRHKHGGDGLVLIEGTQFSNRRGDGTARASNVIGNMMAAQRREHRRRNPSRREPMLAFYGRGDVSDLPSHSTYLLDQNRGLTRDAEMTYALMPDGTLRASVDESQPYVRYPDRAEHELALYRTYNAEVEDQIHKIHESRRALQGLPRWPDRY